MANNTDTFLFSVIFCFFPSLLFFPFIHSLLIILLVFSSFYSINLPFLLISKFSHFKNVIIIFI
ncbi:hypothetical protein MtrunA17_Chr7g0266841 [Medicago truncatula]|uniref:Transmembrane protein n=1 Tax=Medicago truncatula TaxID=3880 RepID=A0A396H626_MEDTR|nr:hypothetical protein MtrunA17_Chr7g0266841 [Medicago truncatula]